MTQIVVGSFSVCWQITQTKTCSYQETYFWVCAARIKTLNAQTSLLWHQNRKKKSEKYIHDFNNPLSNFLHWSLLQKDSEIFGNTDDMQKKSIKLFIGMFTVHIQFFAKLYCNFFERHIQWQHIIDVLWGQQLFLLQNFMNIDGTTLIFFCPYTCCRASKVRT